MDAVVARQGFASEIFSRRDDDVEGVERCSHRCGGQPRNCRPMAVSSKSPTRRSSYFGEKSYAEFQGDRDSLQLDPELTRPYETMKKLKAQGIPVVAVMVTGRPLFVNPALNAADAFVVTWLPGSEGEGLADVIVGDKTGKPRFDFSGKLPTAWPRTATMADGTLYKFGYGLNYTSPKTAWTALTEDPGVKNSGDSRIWFVNGLPEPSWSLVVGEVDGSNETRISTVPSEALSGRMKILSAEYKVQEGARRFELTSGRGAISLSNFDPLNIDKETNGDLSLMMTVKVCTGAEGGIARHDLHW